jgi:hypothetical protein
MLQSECGISLVPQGGSEMSDNAAAVIGILVVPGLIFLALFGLRHIVGILVVLALILISLAAGRHWNYYRHERRIRQQFIKRYGRHGSWRDNPSDHRWV